MSICNSKVGWEQLWSLFWSDIFTQMSMIRKYFTVNGTAQVFYFCILDKNWILFSSFPLFPYKLPNNMYHLLGFRSCYEPKFKAMFIFVLLARIFKELWVKRAACIASRGKSGWLLGLALQNADFTAQGQLGRCPNTSSLNIYLVFHKTSPQLYFPNAYFNVWGSHRPYLIWHYSLQQNTSAKICWSKWGKWWGSLRISTFLSLAHILSWP